MRAVIKLGVVVFIAAAAGFALYAWHFEKRGAADYGPQQGPLLLTGTLIERGRYLATAADCLDCHTAPGGAPFAGGVAFHLPFGTLYSSNLTPDRQTGIGGWTDGEFVRAVRTGVAPGGRHLYPAFPYTAYAGMARDDVLAIKAYLFSLRPVHEKWPKDTVRFPFSQRWGLMFWNALFLHERGFRADPRHSVIWNRGRYLATALGHCGECHTPRNALYALRQESALTGAISQGWKAYDITSTPGGIGHWSAAALTEYLKNGYAPGHGAAAGPMAEVVAYSTSRLTGSDRVALVTYLLSKPRNQIPAFKAAAPYPAGVAPEQGSLGAELYAGACAGCHSLQPDAIEVGCLNLSDSRDARDPQGINLLRLLAEGSPASGPGGLSMPAFGAAYSDTERAAIANFVLAHWGGVASSLTPEDAGRAHQSE